MPRSAFYRITHRSRKHHPTSKQKSTLKTKRPEHNRRSRLKLALWGSILPPCAAVSSATLAHSDRTSQSVDLLSVRLCRVQLHACAAVPTGQRHLTQRHAPHSSSYPAIPVPRSSSVPGSGVGAATTGWFTMSPLKIVMLLNAVGGLAAVEREELLVLVVTGDRCRLDSNFHSLSPRKLFHCTDLESGDSPSRNMKATSEPKLHGHCKVAIVRLFWVFQ